ncbi:MAG: amidase [Alphaproteobacteria bacterium]|nr:amidase [Alphaproteobacteria bacterium]
MSDITELSIAELSRAFRDKSLSPVAATEAYLARISAHNDKVNAFVTLRAEEALGEAKQAEADIAGGGWLGPMHGIPIGHKDLYQTAGIRSTAGSRLLEDHVPTEDATAVARLKGAGAVLLGKLNTHEFAYGPTNDSSMFGPCRNPWDNARFSGGSSGGSGAAVALRMCAGATGSDTGGSIRMPAACCGITGLKPTYGRSSRAGIYPLCWTMDHAGPMTRSAEDAALMYQPMPGPDGRDATVAERAVPDYHAALDGDIKGLKIGVPTHYFYDRALPENADAARDAIAVLEGLGAEVREVDIAHIDYAAAAAMVMYLSEGTAYHDDHIATIGELYTDQVRLFLELGNYILAKDYLHAQRYRTLLGHAMADVLGEVDVLATPSLPLTAQPLGQELIEIRGQSESVFGAILRNTEPFDLTGLPALVMPCGIASDGMPLSLQIAGRPFDEAGVLKVGHAFQQASDWHKRRPPD